MLHLTTSIEDLAIAVGLLKAGAQVALPTETVYGLAADAGNSDALKGIFQAKGRPADHPLIVHLASADEIPCWASPVPELAWRLAEAFWPGPLTLVLPANRGVSPLVTGGQTTVALRVPGHQVMQAILQQFGGGLAAPSANPFGHISPTTAAHVRERLAGKITALVDGGPCPVGIESTIVDLSSNHPAILRPGAITAAMLAAYLPASAPVTGKVPRVPGHLGSHYAPRTPCYRIPPGLAEPPFPGKRQGLMVLQAPNWPVTKFWKMPATPEDYARLLYAVLHEADTSGCDVLLVVSPPDEPEWLAVHDRLRRATRPLDV